MDPESDRVLVSNPELTYPRSILRKVNLSGSQHLTFETLLSYQAIGETIDVTGKARLFIVTLGRIDSLAREGECVCGRLVDIVSCDLTLHTG